MFKNKKEKLIAEVECHFENRKHNLAFDVQDGTGYIYLVADGLQVANVAKLLLLKGKQQTFIARFYEKEQKKAQDNSLKNPTKRGPAKILR